MAKVAIITTFQEFNSWYSLTGIVRDQIRMLTEFGNEVFLFVNEKYKGDGTEFDIPNLTLIKGVPFTHLIDYTSVNDLTEEHQDIANKTCENLFNILTEFNIEIVFTHDIIFLGWSLPYALGIQKVSPRLPKIAWLHWIHSIPTAMKDWWYLAKYGPNHKIVYPNSTDKVRVAEAYRAPSTSVRVIPHIKDIRTMFNFGIVTKAIIDTVPALMQADVVQIYPASSDRFEYKRVADVMAIMGFIKSLGHSVCLFIANQWATTAKHYANIQDYMEKGRYYGLEPGKDLIFSSILEEFDFKVGVPSDVLNQLMMLSNLFVFPTDHETFGLVLPEVSLASGALCVLNRSLHMQIEISGANTLFFDFGSYTSKFEPEDRDEYLRNVAIVIMGRMQENDGIVTRTWMRKRYNSDSLYAKFYAPVMMEARLYVPCED